MNTCLFMSQCMHVLRKWIETTLILRFSFSRESGTGSKGLTWQYSMTFSVKISPLRSIKLISFGTCFLFFLSTQNKDEVRPIFSSGSCGEIINIMKWDAMFDTIFHSLPHFRLDSTQWMMRNGIENRWTSPASNSEWCAAHWEFSNPSMRHRCRWGGRPYFANIVQWCASSAFLHLVKLNWTSMEFIFDCKKPLTHVWFNGNDAF